MDWSNAAPAVFGLLGVVIGTLGTLAVQLLVNRTAEARFRYERDEAVRQEKKEAISSYLEIAQQLEELLEAAFSAKDGSNAGRPVKAVLHRLWVAEKRINLLSTEGLRRAAERLTSQYHQATWDGIPATDADFYSFINLSRTAFLDAARAEIERSEGAD